MCLLSQSPALLTASFLKECVPRLPAPGALPLHVLHASHRGRVLLQAPGHITLAHGTKQHCTLLNDSRIELVCRPGSPFQQHACLLEVSAQPLHLGQRHQGSREVGVQLQTLLQQPSRLLQLPKVSLQGGPGHSVVHGGDADRVDAERLVVQVTCCVKVTLLSLKGSVQVHDLGVLGVVLQPPLIQHTRAVGLAHGSLHTRPHHVQLLVQPVKLIRPHAEGFGQLQVLARQLNGACQHIQRLVCRAAPQRLSHNDASVAHVVALKLC
mmetsp:Transcript_27917/g.61271  ORF Transcript_27917/g.61271 Transcript_27917/m.61271 type:complete len:267 (+) Transcript_27917:1015-1815(+)